MSTNDNNTEVSPFAKGLVQSLIEAVERDSHRREEAVRDALLAYIARLEREASTKLSSVRNSTHLTGITHN